MITPALSARRAQGARELRGRSVSDLEVILAFLETTVARQGTVSRRIRVTDREQSDNRPRVILQTYTDAARDIVDFLRRCTEAGQAATAQLAVDPEE